MPAARRKTLVGDLTPKEVYKISLLSCKSAVFSFITATGKSMPEALIFASTNPQYDNSLFIELPVQYKRIPSSVDGEHWENWVEHVVHISCSECQNKNKKQFLYTTCSPHVLPMEWNFHVLNW